MSIRFRLASTAFQMSLMLIKVAHKCCYACPFKKKKKMICKPVRRRCVQWLRQTLFLVHRVLASLGVCTKSCTFSSFDFRRKKVAVNFVASFFEESILRLVVPFTTVDRVASSTVARDHSQEHMRVCLETAGVLIYI